MGRVSKAECLREQIDQGFLKTLDFGENLHRKFF